MPFELSIALRYLAASRRRAHVAFISAIAVGGLAVGVGALVLSISLLTGFQDRIRERLARNTPHVLLLPARGSLFEDPEPLVRALEAEPETLKASPMLEGRGWITDTLARAALPLRFRASAGTAPPAGTIDVSSSLAGQIGAGPGAEIDVFSSRTVLSPLGPVPVSLRLKVRRMTRSGFNDSGPDAEIALADARTLLGTPRGASGVEAQLRDPEGAEEVASRLKRRLGGAAEVRTWRDLNAGLNFALRMEKVLIFVTVFLIVLVASLSVVSDLSLLVVEKRRDLGVLSTLGAAPGSLMKIVAWLATAIGTAGTLLGAATGGAASWLLDRYALVPLPSDVFLMTHVPFAVHPRDVALAVAFSLAAVFAAAVLPARSAARVGPAEALRLSS